MVVWLVLASIVVGLLVLDLAVIHRKAEVLSLKAASWWSAFWITLGLGFTGAVYLFYEEDVVDSPLDGLDAASRYLSAFLLEKSLSVDNLFVIAVVFESFAVPRAYRHRVLYWGILGAVVLRGLMISFGLWLLDHLAWLFYVFGAYLAYAGIKLLREGDESAEPSGRVIGFLKRFLPLVDGDHGPYFVTRLDGRLVFTSLTLVLLTVEWTDVIFALDSVPAVLAVTDDAFLAMSSNIFAIFGLRALFFVLEALLDRFSKLKYALALILLFVGVKLLLHGHYVIPNLVSLAVISGLLFAGIAASAWARKPDGEGDEDDGG